jgi:hypothetical protein
MMYLQLHPPDGGMFYKETNLHHFFPEPWNMVSSALFLIPAFYWLIKLKGFNKQYAFLSCATWLLLIGCVGSTVYHGLRRWHFFIFMDWVPIALLCLMASVLFWVKVTGKTIYGFLALLVFVGLVLGMRLLFSGHDVQLLISLNYIVMVLMIVLPLVLLLWKMHWRDGLLVLSAFLSFAVAIGFRIADKYTSLGIGTHFLWHTFGAIATSLIFVLFTG